MVGFELNKIAITIGKVLYMLSDIEHKINNVLDIYDHKDELCVIAYACRKGILMRLEKNPVLASNPLIPIKIPTGIFSSQKETIESGLSKTIGKLKDIVNADFVTQKMVENILDGGNLYYQYERILPEKFIKSI